MRATALVMLAAFFCRLILLDCTATPLRRLITSSQKTMAAKGSATLEEKSTPPINT